MLRCLSTVLAPLAMLLANAAAGSAGDDRTTLPRWEYRVLSKEQVLELGQKDLTAGLNHLGIEGWELAAIDDGYIFRRRRVNEANIIAELKQRLAAAEAEVDMRKERLAWSERMFRKGFLAANILETARSRLKQAEMEADVLRHDLDAQVLPLPKKTPAPK